MIWENYIKGWKNIFNFSGRATRAEYWIFNILTWIFLTLLVIAILLPLGLKVEGFNETFGKFGLLIMFIIIPWMIALLSQTVRRIRDIGMSGWWILLFLPINSILYGAPAIIIGLIPSSAKGLSGTSSHQTYEDAPDNPSMGKEKPELKRYEYQASKSKPSSDNTSSKRNPSTPLKRLE